MKNNNKTMFAIKREDARIIDIVADRFCNGQYVVPTLPGQKVDEETKNAIKKAREKNKNLKSKSNDEL